MKKNVIFNFIIIITCILLAQTLCLPVFAETSSDYKNKINGAKKEIEALDGQIDKAMQDVEDLNEQINTLESEIGTLDIELDKLEKSIKEKEEDLVNKQKLLEDRLVAMYIAGDTTYLDVLLSGGFVDFISKYYLVTQMAEYDTNLINEVEQIKQSLESEKKDVETKKQSKEQKSASLKSLKGQKQAKVDSLSEEQKKKQSQVDDWDAKMKELQEAERRAALASSSSGNKYTYSGGQLQWPVPASQRITSYYGYRIHPISGTYKLHSGIDIGASTGTNIVAAEDGQVILASNGYNGGYGNYVIISHGSGLTTRYAHCSKLLVSVGQNVKRGQAIAEVGSTGASTGPHLHFEVRINGESKNPVDYL